MRSLPFGDTIRVWRTARGLTQAQLAHRSHVPRSNLSAIERGRHEVSLGTLRELAASLGIRPGVLADGIAPAHPKTPQPLSREALERIADAVVLGRSPQGEGERALVEALRLVLRPRLAAAGLRAAAPLRRRQRDTNAAWLFLQAAYSHEVIDSLLQRVADRRRVP